MIPTFSWRNISLQSQSKSMHACSSELFTANSWQIRRPYRLVEIRLKAGWFPHTKSERNTQNMSAFCLKKILFKGRNCRANLISGIWKNLPLKYNHFSCGSKKSFIFLQLS